MFKKARFSFSVLYGLYTGLMPLVMSGLVSYWLVNNHETIKSAGLLQMVIFGIIAILFMGFSIIPTSFIALTAGYFWGLQALPFLIISYCFATCIGYYLSKLIDNEQILQEINKNRKAKNIIENLKNDQFKIIALARLSPIFPFGISNVIFTYLGTNLKVLITAGIIGMLPRTIFMLWVSSQATTIQAVMKKNWQEYLVSPIFWIGIVSVIVLLYIVFQAIKKAIG